MQMMRLSSDVYTYYNGYYFARAGLETDLTLWAARGVGFEHTLGTWTDFVVQNISCPRCIFSNSLSGVAEYVVPRFWMYSGCTKDSIFVLWSWRSVVVPLFIDRWTGTMYELLTQPVVYENIYTPNLQFDFKDFSTGRTKDVTLGLISFTKEQDLYDISLTRRYKNEQFTPQVLNTFLHDFVSDHERDTPGGIDRKKQDIQNYFFISNSAEDDSILSFCLDVNIPVPARDRYIKTIGIFRDSSVALEGQVQQPIPTFLIQTYLGL